MHVWKKILNSETEDIACNLQLVERNYIHWAWGRNMKQKQHEKILDIFGNCRNEFTFLTNE